MTPVRLARRVGLRDTEGVRMVLVEAALPGPKQAHVPAAAPEVAPPRRSRLQMPLLLVLLGSLAWLLWPWAEDVAMSWWPAQPVEVQGTAPAAPSEPPTALPAGPSAAPLAGPSAASAALPASVPAAMHSAGGF